MKSEKARKRDSEEQAKKSVTGNDRMVENADLSNTGTSGSTTGDSKLNYGMGEEGVPAPGYGLGAEESALTGGVHNSEQGGDSRQHRDAGQRSGGSTQGSKTKHDEKKHNGDGGGPSQERGGG